MSLHVYRFLFLLISLPIGSIYAQETGSLLKKYSDSLRFHESEKQRALYNDSFKNLLYELFLDDKPFDVLLDSIKQTVSVVESEDGKMRVITWFCINSKEEYSKYGVVLYRKKNKPKATQHVFWLKDFTDKRSDSIYDEFDQDHWPGALYYQIYHFKKKRKHYYCVLGFDGDNSFHNYKIIDVLWVDRSGELHIGAPVFYSSETDFTPQYRVYFEYADQASMVLRFEKEEKIITFSNLSPSGPDRKGKKQYYIPDGRIDVYRLKRKGKWIYYPGLEEFKFEGNE